MASSKGKNDHESWDLRDTQALRWDEIFDVLPQHRLFNRRGTSHAEDFSTRVTCVSWVYLIAQPCDFPSLWGTHINIYNYRLSQQPLKKILFFAMEDLQRVRKYLWRPAVSNFHPIFRHVQEPLSTSRLRGAMVALLMFISFLFVVIVSGWTSVATFKCGPTVVIGSIKGYPFLKT